MKPPPLLISLLLATIAAAEVPVGYRYDGSGIWPDARPPLAWNLEEGINIAWRVELPHGIASPVPHRGRLLVTAEPNRLYCLDQATGRILWQREFGEPPPPDTRLRRPRPTSVATVTPVAHDGRVYVHFGNGTVACLDLGGNVIWQINTGASWSHPNMGSPVLVDGLLVLQTNLPGNNGAFALLALDSASGEQRWTARGGFAKGIVVMRLASGERVRTLLITGDGALIDPADGSILQRTIFTTDTHRAAPTVHGNVVYAAPVTGEEAVELTLDAAGNIVHRRLWRNPPFTGSGQRSTTVGTWHWMKGPVVHDGLMYVWRVDRAHVPGHYPLPWGQLEVYDINTGQRLIRRRALTTEATDPTINPAIAGGHLFLGDGGDPAPGLHGNTEYGQLTVVELLQPGVAERQLIPVHNAIFQGQHGLVGVVSRNRLGRMRASPAFDGDRLFVRQFDSVVCIRTETDAGRRYELEQLAEVTFNELIRRRPEPALRPRPEPLEVARASISPLQPRRTPANWLALATLPGPRPPAEDWLAAIGGENAARPVEGTEITFGELTLAFAPLPANARTREGDLLPHIAARGRENHFVYYYTVLNVTDAQRLQYAADAAEIATWLAGQPIRTGDVIDFSPGRYPLLVRHRNDPQPPFLDPFALAIRFNPLPDTMDTHEAWLARAQLLRPRLQRVAAAELGAYSNRAAAVLRELDEQP